MLVRNNSRYWWEFFCIMAYDLTQELDLREQIKEAQAANDFATVRELTKQLVAIQEIAPKVKMTDEQLADVGVDLLLLDKERKLAEQIKEAKQNGDFTAAGELMRELLKVQKLQPEYTGIKLRE